MTRGKQKEQKHTIEAYIPPLPFSYKTPPVPQVGEMSEPVFTESGVHLILRVA
jgi:hypothetical protein